MRPRLPLERICAQYGRCLGIVRIQHCKRLKGVCQGGTSPLTLFCFLLQEQKEAPRGERC